MNKTQEIFEKNVEWIAIGVGGLWFLWIIWAYILTPPAITVTGAPQKLTPATIDEYIQNNTGDKLAKIIANTALYPDIKAGEYKPSWQFPVPGPIAGISVGSDPAPKQIDTPEIDPNRDRVVKALPVLPPPTDLGLSMGRSQVTVPPPPAASPIAGAPGAAAAIAPVAVRPAAGAAAGAVKPAEAQVVDKSWVWLSALLDPMAIDKAFADVKIPEFLRQTPDKVVRQRFVYVQLERAEVKPDGTLGEPVILKELPINALPLDPKDEKQRDNLIQWLDQQQNQTRVINPGFYQRIGGDDVAFPPPGSMPGSTTAVVNNPSTTLDMQRFIVNGKFDVAAAYSAYKNLGPKEKEEFRSHLTPEQKQLLYKAEQDDKQKPGTPGRPTAPYRPTPGPTPRPVPTPTPHRDAVDPEVLRQMFAQATPPQRSGARPGDFIYRPYTGREPGAMPYRPMDRGNQPGVPGTPIPTAPPPGVNADGKLPIWQFDETPEPGKTYKYRIRVVMLNPVYKSDVADDAVKEVFLIQGTPSEWSKPLTIPASLKWYLVQANVTSQAEKAVFRIIKWEKGKANTSPAIPVNPGDTIGGPDKASGVDYDTGWHLVDVRQLGAGDFRATLVNERGEIMVRRSRQDVKDFEKENAILSGKASAMAN